MAKTIAITNHKGGSGKTTSVINLGAALTQLRHSCLLVDLDPQSNLTISLGIDPKGCQHSIYTALAEGDPLQPIEIAKGLHLVPSTADLVGAELKLVGEQNREHRLRNLLAPIKNQYKYVLLDCAPSLGVITLNALTAADALYIPLQAQYLALHGLEQMHQVVGMVQESTNRELELAGVFLTQYDSRKVLHRNVKEMAEEALGETLCKTIIRDNVALAEAPALGQTIFQYAPKSKGAQDYMALAREIRKQTR